MKESNESFPIFLLLICVVEFNIGICIIETYIALGFWFCIIGFTGILLSLNSIFDGE